MVYQFGEKSKRGKAGFTLIEMITSISLIVIITAIFIANYRSSNKRSDLIMTAQKLVADIHAAQNNTLGLIKYGDEVPPGGWGIHFDKNDPLKYTMFADLDRPASTEPPDIYPSDAGFMSYDSTVEGDIDKGARVVELPQGISIIDLDMGHDADNSTIANVSFLPPDPKTNIFNGVSTSTYLEITLKEARENKIKTVRVNFLGLVEVID